MSDVLSAPAGALFAEFDSPDVTRLACARLRELGHNRIETYSPYPIVPERTNQFSWTMLGVITFAAAAAGAALGYGVQWYANAYSYPLDIGGRPPHAVPAFVIPALETTILCTGLAAFVTFLLSLRLPRLWQPQFEIDGFERASFDRYWIGVSLGSGGDEFIASTIAALETFQPLRILHGSAGP